MVRSLENRTIHVRANLQMKSPVGMLEFSQVRSEVESGEDSEISNLKVTAKTSNLPFVRLASMNRTYGGTGFELRVRRGEVHRNDDLQLYLRLHIYNHDVGAPISER